MINVTRDRRPLCMIFGFLSTLALVFLCTIRLEASPFIASDPRTNQLDTLYKSALANHRDDSLLRELYLASTRVLASGESMKAYYYALFSLHALSNGTTDLDDNPLYTELVSKVSAFSPVTAEDYFYKALAIPFPILNDADNFLQIKKDLLRIAINMNPSYYDALYERLQVSILLEDYKQALHDGYAIKKARPDDPRSDFAIGDAYMANREYELAITHYNKGLSSLLVNDQDRGWVLFNKANALRNLGKDQDAIETMIQYLQLSEDSPAGNLDLGIWLIGTARERESVYYLDRFLLVNPNDQKIILCAELSKVQPKTLEVLRYIQERCK